MTTATAGACGCWESRTAARELEGEPLAIDPARVGRLLAGGWRVAGPQGPRVTLDRRGSVAVVPLLGLVTPRATWASVLFGGAPLDQLRDTLRSTARMASVHTIVLSIDSPGGSVYGVEEAAAAVREASASGTRVIAVADSLAASAAYWIGSAADELVVSPSAEVGSIGVVWIHFDWSERMKSDGVAVTIIRAGDHKAEWNPYAPLSDDAAAHEQSLVDDYYRSFVRDVAQGRGVSAQVVLDQFGQGRTFTARRAVELGMADRVATIDEVVAEAQAGKGSGRRARAMATTAADPLLGYVPVDAARWGRFMATADESTRRTVRRVAIHEAGHAVANLQEGAGLLGVGLELDDAGRFAGGSALAQRVAGRRDVLAAAGIAAELVHGFAYRQAADDLQRVEAAHYAAGKAVNVPRSIADARALVAPHFDGIKRLATALEVRGWIPGAEAARLLELET